MKTEYKERLLAALKSGKYQHAKEFLRTSEGYCCLGVLCDITKDEFNGKWKGDYTFTCDGTDRARSYLPDAIANAVWLSDDDLDLLMDLNDRSREGFGPVIELLEGGLW